MRIIFVRHGHPNYEKDCLTPLGHLHAQAAAKRLADEKITKIYSSTCGRAVETAGYLAADRGMTVESYDFIRELSWGSVDDQPIYLDGHPWSIADDIVSKGENLLDDWLSRPMFEKSKLPASVTSTVDGFDQWLAGLGYERDGLYYRVCRKNDDTVAMVSHGGSSSAVLAHLFNLSFLYFCGTVHPDFTAITIVYFDGEKGSLITPRIEILNDCRHIEGIEAPGK